MAVIVFAPTPCASHSITQGRFGGESKTAVSTLPLPVKAEYPIGVAVGVGVGGPTVGVTVGTVVAVGGTVGTGVGT